MQKSTLLALILLVCGNICGDISAQSLSAPDMSGITNGDDNRNIAKRSDAHINLDEVRQSLLNSLIESPRIFTGFRHIQQPSFETDFPNPKISLEVWKELAKQKVDEDDSFMNVNEYGFPLLTASQANSLKLRDGAPTLSPIHTPIPNWLSNFKNGYRILDDAIYMHMIENPIDVQYAYWDLPEIPRIPEEDFSFRGYLKRMKLPQTAISDSITDPGFRRTNWLHTFNIALQLSQAYISPNWYQGGNSYLAFLGNFLWDVQLNPAYYPNIMFQSTVSYKLAINSTPDDEYHKYSISQDLFQYNLKTGYKAIHNWYYTFLMQFKTQFLHSYPANSLTRSASFLSPGELNLGIGMTYSKENANRTLRFSASISPVSYNLKTCIDSNVDHATYGIAPDRKWVNEVGSNAEVNFYAEIWKNMTYTTRLFLFTDYSSFLTDWENTFNFQFSKVFSTQLYAHFRYDTSTNANLSKWKKCMLKEILSVGISYTFSTK